MIGRASEAKTGASGIIMGNIRSFCMHSMIIFGRAMGNPPQHQSLSIVSRMTLSMEELNGNEKFKYLDQDLPTKTYKPGTIHAGDLMLYGSDCLVLFYQTFQSGYSYTKIGRILKPQGLKKVLGDGNVKITISK